MVGTFTEKKTLIKVDGQDRKLQLPKVKTGNAELLCHMASKLDIVILIKMAEYHEYLLYELINKIKESRILYNIPHILLHTSYHHLRKR